MRFPDLLAKVARMEDEVRMLAHSIDQLWSAFDREVDTGDQPPISSQFRRRPADLPKEQ